MNAWRALLIPDWVFGTSTLGDRHILSQNIFLETLYQLPKQTNPSISKTIG